MSMISYKPKTMQEVLDKLTKQREPLKNNTLKLVLTDHWYEEIKSGRKKYEYRKVTPFWQKRIEKVFNIKVFSFNTFYFEMPEEQMPLVEFQKAYRKNPERMTFRIKSISTMQGKHTDLQYDGLVFAIRLGDKING